MTIPRSRPGLAQILTLIAFGVSVACLGGHPPSARAQSAEDAFVERVLASLTPDERIGQLVMVNFVGGDVSAGSDVAALIRDYKIGAVPVTASNGNVVNRDDTARATRRPHERPPAAGLRGDAPERRWRRLLSRTGTHKCRTT